MSIPPLMTKIPAGYVLTVDSKFTSGIPYVNFRMNEHVIDIAYNAKGETGSTEIHASGPFGPGLPFRKEKGGPVGTQIFGVGTPLTDAQRGAFERFDTALRASGVIDFEDDYGNDRNDDRDVKKNYDITLRDPETGAHRSWFASDPTMQAPFRNLLDAVRQLRTDLG